MNLYFINFKLIYKGGDFMIGFVTLNFNESKKCVNLANQCFDSKIFDYIVVVDNCSDKEEYDYLIKNLNPNIVLLQSGTNRGFACGNNIGLKYLASIPNVDQILIANPDVIFDCNIVKKFSSIINNDRTIGALSCLRKEFDGSEIDSFWNEKSIKEMYRRFLLIRNKLFPFKKVTEKKRNDLFFVDCVRGSFIYFRVSALQSVDFFDENTFLYYEEDILFNKLKQKGYKVGVLNNYYYTHNHPYKKNKKTNISILKNTYKSMYYYLCKYRNIGRFDKIRFYILSSITILEFRILNLFRN